jgi:hypothetical protein
MAIVEQMGSGREASANWTSLAKYKWWLYIDNLLFSIIHVYN